MAGAISRHSKKAENAPNAKRKADWTKFPTAVEWTVRHVARITRQIHQTKWRLPIWQPHLFAYLVSERVPGRLVSDLQISDVDAKARADTGANRHQKNAVALQNIHTNTRNEIG